MASFKDLVIVSLPRNVNSTNQTAELSMGHLLVLLIIHHVRLLDCIIDEITHLMILTNHYSAIKKLRSLDVHGNIWSLLVSKFFMKRSIVRMLRNWENRIDRSSLIISRSFFCFWFCFFVC